MKVVLGSGRLSLSLSRRCLRDVDLRKSAFRSVLVGSALTYHHSHMGPLGQHSG